MSYAEYLKKAKSEKISKHFTLYEICYSQTAQKQKIDNTPTAPVIENARALIKKVLEPIREYFNKAVNVNCMFRSPQLNASPWINGATNSQHKFGQACDFTVSGVALQEVFDWIKHNLVFDQLIDEGSWIHVSYSLERNRKQALRLANKNYVLA